MVARSELSRAEFGISGKVTRLQLAGEAHAFGTPRDVTVMAVSEPLTVVEAPDDSAVAGYDARRRGRRDRHGSGPRAGAGRGDPRRHAAVRAGHRRLGVARRVRGRRVVLELAPKSAYDRSTAVVYGNVARATHGETVHADPRLRRRETTFQAFTLRQSPLTFVPADTPRGSASTLEVQVDEVPWAERPSTYGAVAADRVFVTRDEPDGTVTSCSATASSARARPSGSNNVRATYRKGPRCGRQRPSGRS